MDNKCVLVFEDDQDILDLIKNIFKSKYNVETRSTTEDIFLAVRETNPDIILMDLRIPDIGGSDATLLLKSNSKTNNIPVLLLSANPNIEAIARKTGADGFIKKPFDVKGITRTIEAFLMAKGESVATSSPPAHPAPGE
jgi:DNA-binding response OmpR family regulator